MGQPVGLSWSVGRLIGRSFGGSEVSVALVLSPDSTTLQMPACWFNGCCEKSSGQVTETRVDGILVVKCCPPYDHVSRTGVSWSFIYTLVNVLGERHNPHKGQLVAGLRCQFWGEDVSKDQTEGSRTWTVQAVAASGQKKRRYRTKRTGKCTIVYVPNLAPHCKK